MKIDGNDRIIEDMQLVSDVKGVTTSGRCTSCEFTAKGLLLRHSMKKMEVRRKGTK